MTAPEKRLEGVDAVRAFVTAGNAIFTLRNPATGNRFTFRVRRSEPREGAEPILFVGVLTGEDNTGDYSYLGCIFPDGFRVTKKSRISADAPSARAFAWFWRRVSAGADVSPAEVWHTGHCGRCGRLLTVPESIETGLGPVCAEAA